ncbi:MAG: protein kinase domain-containing protein, partial [Plesiomonas shigelloides]
YVSETLARHFMRQVVIAAQHWLDHGVNHGDLSLKNVLINTETKQVKVIDFGCSQLISTINDLPSGYCGEFLCIALSPDLMTLLQKMKPSPALCLFLFTLPIFTGMMVAHYFTVPFPLVYLHCTYLRKCWVVLGNYMV